MRTIKEKHQKSKALRAGMVLTLCLALSAAGACPAGAAVEADPSLWAYESVSGVSGNLNSIGSDTLNNLMTLWAEAFRAIYPNVNIQIEGKGSSTAPVALIEGTAQLGPMSRPMKSSEIDAFEKKYGYKPTEIKVAIDALAVYVHRENPIRGLTLRQVDGIFSSTLKAGGSSIETWGQAGLSGGDWVNRPISLYGRNSASGTYGMFRDVVLRGGDYRTTVKEQPGSSAVVQGVASDLGGIGYSGIGYRTSGVRVVPLAGGDGNMYEPTPENCLTGNYPLARFLYVYINKPPVGAMDKLTKEFLRFVVSKAGQDAVVRDGYFPMPVEVSDEVLDHLS
jgi:phosphate transport system substrate-binding protein